MSGLGLRLDALNFFLADVRGGLGPFVSVYLATAAGWSAAEIGAVLTVSGLVGITLHAPLGAIIDAIEAKRLLLVAGVALLAACALAIQALPVIPVVFAADVVMAALGGLFAPTVAALTLGLVPERAFATRLGRNAVFDRAGNIAIAALVGVVGWWWSQRAPFYLIPLFAVASAVAVMTIPSAAVDQERARGFVHGQPGEKPQGFVELLAGNRPLLLFALLAATFNFGNGTMVFFIGQKLALAHPGYETALTSACILVAQLVTIPVAFIAGARADAWGTKPLLIAACLAVVVRGVIFAVTDSAPVLVAAQVFDGISSGLWDVLVPLVIDDLVVGSGRYSTSRGVVGTVQGAGGSISNVCTGALATWSGYGAAFLMLAVVGAIACVLAVLFPDPAAVKAGRLARVRTELLA